MTCGCEYMPKNTDPDETNPRERERERIYEYLTRNHL
jgi:hypothetical protein